MLHALLFMAEPTLACESYISKYISHVFSDTSLHRTASLLHWGLITMTSPRGNSSLRTYAFSFKYGFLAMMELTVLCHRFLTSGTPSGSIVAKLRTLQPATVARAWYSQ